MREVKIGDELEIVSCLMYGHHYPVGTIVTVVNLWEDGVYEVEGVSKWGTTILQDVHPRDVKLRIP